MQRIAPFIPEVARARHAVLCRSRAPGGYGNCSQCAWDCKRAHIQIIQWCAGVILNGSDHIWPIETGAAAAEIILEIVVELEWLPALQSHRAVHTPAILQPLPVPAHGRQVVGKNPGE